MVKKNVENDINYTIYIQLEMKMKHLVRSKIIGIVMNIC